MPNEMTLPGDFEERFPGSSRKATEGAMNLVLTSDMLVGRIATLVRPYHLSPGSGLVLSILADASQPLSPHEIAEKLIISRATVTGLLDSLEKRGYLKRSAHTSDRRKLSVTITPEGAATAQKFRTLVHERQNAWFGVLNAREKETLLRLLRKLQGSLDKVGV